MASTAVSPIRQTYEHYSARGMVRPWTAKPQMMPPEQDDDEATSRVPSLMELCMDMISNNLHTFPCIDDLPSHLMKDILDRRKNESMTDGDLPFFLAATFEAVPPDQLDFLGLRACSKVTDEGFEFVFRSCPYLQVLDLSFCELVGDKSLQALAESCPRLESLNLTGCRQVSDACCLSLARLKGLKVVELELCNKVTDIGIQSIIRACNSNLQVLNLGDVRNMSNISIQIVADHCPSLLSLSIAGNMQAMDMDVGDVCKKATALQSLNLRACRRLTDGCLKPISALLRGQHKRGVQALTALDLGGCGRLTENEVNKALPLFSSLTRLDLRGCKNLTPLTKQLIQKYCVNMQDLTFPPLSSLQPLQTES